MKAFIASESYEEFNQLVYRIRGEGEFAVWNASSWSILQDDVFTSMVVSRLEASLNHGSIYLQKLVEVVTEKLKLDDENDDSDVTNAYRATRGNMLRFGERLNSLRFLLLKVHRTHDFIKFLKGRDWMQICPTKFNPRRSLGLIPYYNGCVFAGSEPPVLVHGNPSDFLLWPFATSFYPQAPQCEFVNKLLFVLCNKNQDIVD